ncbi:MAG: metalloregulator ArsR/SmtB family transcription factor [Haliangiales bacterium]
MDETNAIFRALADPSRRAIFERLTQGELSVKELTASFHISQPAVSQHLATLSKAALVVKQRDGRKTFYRVAPEGLRPLVDWITRYRAFWTERVDALQTLLEEIEE